jgi:hypothetical protein
MHHLQRGGVDRVSAEVAEEVGMFLQHQHLDAGTSQQQSQHHAGRTAARDAATHRHRLRTHIDLDLEEEGRTRERLLFAKELYKKSWETARYAPQNGSRHFFHFCRKDDPDDRARAAPLIRTIAVNLSLGRLIDGSTVPAAAICSWATLSP